MKRMNLKRWYATMVVAIISLAGATHMMAQQTKVADREIVGVWVMESMQFDGEKKQMCGDTYTQVKVYRANGEYACAELVKTDEGKFVVLPHEYGTYSFKNGAYTEMGRKGDMTLVDKNTFKGRWKNRNDIWKKKAVPANLSQFIVDRCKAAQIPSSEMQKLIGQHFFKASTGKSDGKAAQKKVYVTTAKKK